MKTKPPRHRRKFANDWDEIGYLYDKLLYWLYGRQDPEKACPYAQRLEQLLKKADPQHEAIFGEDCRSLIFETKGDLPRAIKHRENEIRLIRHLHDLSRDTPHEQSILKDYGIDDLSDRLDLLAALYYDAGDLKSAIRVLRESKKLCNGHGLKFDGADLLRECLKDQRDHEVANEPPRLSRNGQSQKSKPGTAANLNSP